MDGSVFYIVGGALVLAALVLSAIGIRRPDSFPRSKGEMAGILTIFAVIVAGTAAYAVANAREEADHREHELAAEEASAEAGVAEQQGSEQAGAAPAAQQPEGQGEQTLDLTSPEDGSLAFEPDALAADAGTITLAYDNPSPITHNIAIEDEQGEVLAQSDDVTQGAVDATAPLVPGQYLYFCAIPGHREGGMEGTLEVQ